MHVIFEGLMEDWHCQMSSLVKYSLYYYYYYYCQNLIHWSITKDFQYCFKWGPVYFMQKTRYLQRHVLKSSYGNKVECIHFYTILFSVMHFLFYHRTTSILILPSIIFYIIDIYTRKGSCRQSNTKHTLTFHYA